MTNKEQSIGDYQVNPEDQLQADFLRLALPDDALKMTIVKRDRGA
ncbi:MAG: hypothetical protein AAGU05_00310 [Anaerolineaceae bacterium]